MISLFQFSEKKSQYFFWPNPFWALVDAKGIQKWPFGTIPFRGVPFFAGGCFDGNRQCGLWTKPREAKNMKLKRKIKLEHYFWTFASSLVPIFKFTADICGARYFIRRGMLESTPLK